MWDLRVFFFNDTATTEIYTLSLHDALPISIFSTINVTSGNIAVSQGAAKVSLKAMIVGSVLNMILDPVFIYKFDLGVDRKSTRLNSSHANISYAVFCLKKKN